MPMTSTPRCEASPAPHARWGSTSSTDVDEHARSSPPPRALGAATESRWEAKAEPGEEMAKVGKRKKAGDALLEKGRKYTVEEAVAIVKQAAKCKFDETVDLAVRLGVNPKHADQMVRGAIVLPHGTGQKLRVLVFAKGEKEKEALGAGADFAGSDELVQKVSEGFMDFDRVIATPDMMGAVGKLGRILGPRGLMPNPKVGTVTFDVTNAVKEAKAGKVEYRVEKAGIRSEERRVGKGG